MKKFIIRFSIGLILILGFWFGLTTTVSAFSIQGSIFEPLVQSEPTPTPSLGLTPKQEKTCLKTNASITKELQSSTKRENKHTKAVEKKKKMWADKIAQLERKKCKNVGRVKGDLRNLNRLYDRWHENWVDGYTEYTDKLSTTLQISCVDDFSNYKQSVKEARKLRKEMLIQEKENKEAIEKYLKDPVYVHLKLVTCS